ncbi:MAG: MFS family permease [Alphaproteobacteria bacterium]
MVAPFAALLLSVALLLMGSGLQGTLLPIRAGIEGYSALDIGILGSSYYLGFALGCLGGPHVVRRVGHIRAFAALAAAAACVVLIHALIVNPAIWWFLRAGTGFCLAVLYMVIESWLNEKSTNENRGLVFSTYTIINLTVTTAGQLMLMFDDPKNFPLYALASILIALAVVPVALTTSAAPAPIAAVKIRIRHLYRLSPVGVVGCAAVGLVNGSFWTLAPVFAHADGGSVANVALFMSIAVIAGAIGQWPLGLLSDRIDRRKVIVLASIGAALAGAGMVALAHTFAAGTLVFAFLFGIFALPLYTLCVAHLNDFVEPAGYIEAASGLLLVYALGAVAGPMVASLAIRFIGIESLFGYTACVHLAMAAFAYYRLRERAPAPKEEHINFADAIRFATTVSAVDPLSVAPQAELEQIDTVVGGGRNSS